MNSKKPNQQKQPPPKLSLFLFFSPWDSHNLRGVKATYFSNAQDTLL